MEIVKVLQVPEQWLPEMPGLISSREWFDRLMDDIAAIMEAIAADDNRLDV